MGIYLESEKTFKQRSGGSRRAGYTGFKWGKHFRHKEQHGQRTRGRRKVMGNQRGRSWSIEMRFSMSERWGGSKVSVSGQTRTPTA